MGLRTRAKLDRTIEEPPQPDRGQDPHLAAALAAVLVEYRRSTRRDDGQVRSEQTGSNWRIMTRMAQLQRRP
jgi:hypothetical protein